MIEYKMTQEEINMKRLLILLMAAMMLVACGDSEYKEYEKQRKEAEKNLKESESELERVKDVSKQIDKTSDSLKELQGELGAEEISVEGIHRVSNINLDEFIESFNGMAKDGDYEQFQRDGNENIVADGLLISVNEDGTVWGIVYPVQPTTFSVVATLLSIKSQSKDEEAESIDVFLDDFVNAMDGKEELYIDQLNIESMEINVSTINGEVFLFNVLGEEQLK